MSQSLSGTSHSSSLSRTDYLREALPQVGRDQKIKDDRHKYTNAAVLLSP